MWRGGPSGDLGPWLNQHGWRGDIRDVGQVAADYGRNAPPAFESGRDGASRAWLVTAAKTTP